MKQNREHSKRSEPAEHSADSEESRHSNHSESSEHSEHAEPFEQAEQSEHQEHPEHSEHQEHSYNFDANLSSKNNGVLTMALETPEQSGSVREVGGFVRPRDRQAQLEKEDLLDEVKKMIEQQGAYFKAKIAELEAKIDGGAAAITLPTPTPNPSGKAGCSGKENNVLEDNEIDFEELAVGKRDAIKVRIKTIFLIFDLYLVLSCGMHLLGVLEGFLAIHLQCAFPCILLIGIWKPCTLV